MIKRFKNIFACTMALLVLFSTVSFTVAKHYCGGFLVDTALFSKADACIMSYEPIACDLEISKKSCCSDEAITIKGQDDLNKVTLDEFSFEQQVFITSLIYSYKQLFSEPDTQVIPDNDYSPPPLVYDIHVLNETYLI